MEEGKGCYRCESTTAVKRTALVAWAEFVMRIEEGFSPLGIRERFEISCQRAIEHKQIIAAIRFS